MYNNILSNVGSSLNNLNFENLSSEAVTFHDVMHIIYIIFHPLKSSDKWNGIYEESVLISYQKKTGTNKLFLPVLSSACHIFVYVSFYH